MLGVANRLALIKPSSTFAIVKKSAELKKLGVDLISLGAGEPDFDTPKSIKEAAIQAINGGVTKYTAVEGLPALKQAIQAKFKRDNHLDYALDELMVSSGAKQVIYNLFMATLNPGDEVIIPAPYWVSYPDMVLLAEGAPIITPCSMTDHFKLTPEHLAQQITSKTKWLILNSPNNPTGAGYSEKELQALAECLRQYPQVQILCDDIYEHIIFDDYQFCTLAQVAEDLKSRIVIVNGVSKAYSMTGWRIGYCAGPASLIKAMILVQSQSTSNPCSISQMAAIEALQGDQSFIQKHAVTFQKKRDSALSILSAISGLCCYKPVGAFYLLIQCEKLLGRRTPTGQVIQNDLDFSDYLLDQARVAVVPGSAFGAEGYFRISYALSLEDLECACLRIGQACDQLVA
jgi:aspartate aminotransferase